MSNIPRLPNVEDIDSSMAPPTVVVNRYLVTTHENGVRLAFGDSSFTGEKIFYRSAVFMSLEQADELRMVLEELLEPLQGMIAEARARQHGS